MEVLLFLTLLLAATSSAEHDDSFCNITSTDTSQGRFPGLPESFSAFIEDKTVSVATLSSVRVKVNPRGGRMEWKSSYMNTVIIVDKQTQEIFTVNRMLDSFDPYACLTSNSSTKENPRLVEQTNQYLTLLSSLPKHFEGRRTVRNMAADILTSCQYDAQRQVSVKVEWAIANNHSATGENALTSIPLQMTITNRVKRFNSTITKNLHIFQFQSPLPIDDDILEIPDKFVCPNKKVTRPLPQLPLYFSFKSEIAFAGSSRNYLLEEYDYFTKLTRMDFYPDFPFDNYRKYGEGLLTRIHDYNMGVEFVRDNENNKCFYHAINETSSDTRQLNNTINWRMADPGEFFHLETNRTFQYSGQRKTRGQLTHVFVSQREVSVPLEGGSVSTVNATYTWFFVENQGPNADPNDVTYIPIRMEYFSQLEAYDLNIFDFKTQEPTLMKFSVSECFDNLLNEVLVMEFDVSVEIASRINKRLDQFKHWFELALGWNSQVSFLRARIDEVTLVSNSRVSTRFTLFEKPVIAGTQDLFLKEAIELLNNTVNNESFAFWMPNDKNILDPVHIPKGSLRKYNNDPGRTSPVPPMSLPTSNHPIPTEAPPTGMYIDKGLFVAVVILLLLGGLVLGGGIVYLIYRKNGSLPGGQDWNNRNAVSISAFK